MVLFSRHCLEAVHHDDHHDTECEELKSSGQLVGSNLLQVRSDFPMPNDRKLPKSAPGPNGMRRITDSKVRSHAILTAPDPGSASEVLPPHLLQLGREMLGSEDALNELVDNSRVENMTYAGVTVLARMLNGDMSNDSMVAGGDSYGLESLRKTSPTGKLHVLDLGGSYGIVSIAAFKKYPKDV